MSHRVSNTPINPPLIRLILYRNTLHQRAYKHTGENIDRYYKRCCSRRGDAVAATRVTHSPSQVKKIKNESTVSHFIQQDCMKTEGSLEIKNNGVLV